MELKEKLMHLVKAYGNARASNSDNIANADCVRTWHELSDFIDDALVTAFDAGMLAAHDYPNGGQDAHQL